jgi:hypothetical protein
MSSFTMMLAAANPLLPVRVVAAVALIAVVATFVHVLRHLKQIEKTIMADNVVPDELGPRNNLVLMVCAIPVILVALLVFLVIKA